MVNSCSNQLIGSNIVMMNPNNGMTSIEIEAEEPELLSIQLHYSLFLTQKPVVLFLDSKKRPVNNESMKHMMLKQGNHTLTIFNRDLSLDETCILISLVEYEVPISTAQIGTMPGISLKPGVQSIIIDTIEKGATSLPLPNLMDYKNDTMFLSTLLIHFDRENIRIGTPNYVELDMNFDTSKVFDYKSQLYYESTKDKLISYTDMTGITGSLVNKQFEVIHTKDFKYGSYLAHFVVFNAEQIATKFDMCNEEQKTGKIQSLDSSAVFLYNEFGKEDFTLAVLNKDVQEDSKFYDKESNVFYIEIKYQIKEPSFIEFSVEYDLSMQNVDIFIFQDFDDEITLEDQQLVDSTIDIPSMQESTASRHARVYLSKAGEYSVFIVDKKLPTIYRQMTVYGQEPCSKLKISHSIQPFSLEPLVDQSVSFLSVWPRRLELGDPFFVNTRRNLEVIVYPNTLKLNRKKPPQVKFAVIDLNTNKRLYVIEPDKVTIVVPMRKTVKKQTSFVNEIELRCFFKSETLKNVIGGGRLLTLAEPDKVSDKTMVPYYVIVDTVDDRIAKMEIQPNKTSTTQQVKDKLTLRQQRDELNKNVDAIKLCYSTCKFGDCNKNGVCVCRQGYTGTNCDKKHEIGKLDKLAQKKLERVNNTKKITQGKPVQPLVDDENDYDDEEDMLETIRTVETPKVEKFSSTDKKDTKSTDSKPVGFSWFDMFLVFCLLFGIAIVFYQNLWSGRFCRKKIAKKLKYDEEEDGGDQEDKAIIKEELSFVGDQIEMPRIRNRHIE